jgi:hypothetical protein
VQPAEVDELVEILAREIELAGSLSDRKSFFSLSRHIEVLSRRLAGDYAWASLTTILPDGYPLQSRLP